MEQDPIEPVDPASQKGRRLAIELSEVIADILQAAEARRARAGDHRDQSAPAA